MCVRVVTVVQARASSTRLPGKVLRPVLGRPVLLHQLDRMKRADLVGEIVVATTHRPDDDTIADLCQSEGFTVVRGSEHDLLDRHVAAARVTDAEAVVKVPSDCPLIDPRVIDLVIATFLDGEWDYMSNLHPPTWPDGNDVEVITRDALVAADRGARQPFEREHTTPFIWDHPDRFRIGNVAWPSGRDFSMTHRWTLDYPADLDFISGVYEALTPPHQQTPEFSTEDVLSLLDRRPDLHARNAHLAGVNWYRHHLDELSTVHSEQTRLAPEEME